MPSVGEEKPSVGRDSLAIDHTAKALQVRSKFAPEIWCPCWMLLRLLLPAACLHDAGICPLSREFYHSAFVHTDGTRRREEKVGEREGRYARANQKIAAGMYGGRARV